MTSAPVAFQSNPGKYSFEGIPQLINAYAEKRGPDAKAALSILPCDGIIQLADEAPGPCRGLIYLEDLDKAYSFHPSSVYKLTESSGTVTATRIGTIPGVDPVQLSRNQKTDPQIVVRSNSGVQIIESDSVSYLLDDDLPGDVVTAEYIGGYTSYGIGDRRFFISSLNSSKLIDALDFATFEQRAGKLIRIVENAGEMIGFCSTWLEFWRDTGNSDFPFQPMGFRSRGLKAANSVVSCDNTLMFPGDDGIVYRLNGYDPFRISSHHVERLIQEDAASADMIGFSWTRAGHAFANFTGTDWTRCYDAVTQAWHSRQSYGLDRWRARYSIKAWGKTIVGDAISGKLGYFDADTYTEYGDPMVWGIDSPPMHVFPNGAIVDAVHFDLATGAGTLSGQGSSPGIMLQVSTDGGNTFGQYRELSLGARGNTSTRVTARRLGRFGPKGIVFRLRISDPVARALVGTDVEIRPLRK